ncbi:hypothetical protein [Paraflavitalea speifideaquila]|uniref:primosomal protein N' family DNA-binding protein n=1 Tax=Paraflavitalea speifideaquila TaxID=3076558 RepID=UPI0028EC34BF|nr:hypothetical protein [Paraflavitalea speifideiaquila]
MFAEIIIPLALPKNYTWAVPAHLLEQVKVGVRVEVGLKQTKRYAGVVKRLHNEKPEFLRPRISLIYWMQSRSYILNN